MKRSAAGWPCWPKSAGANSACPRALPMWSSALRDRRVMHRRGRTTGLSPSPLWGLVGRAWGGGAVFRVTTATSTPPTPKSWSKPVHRPGEVLAAAALIVGIAPSALASDAALAEAANKEGSVTIYACDPPQTPLYVERFKKLYPKVQVHTYVAGCWQIYNRHSSERQAKRQAADVFFATEDVMSRMSSEHLIEAYRSPELVHFAPAAAPPGKDYLIVKTLIYGMASNREFTKGIPVPNDWLDYLEPPAAWRDRISYYDPRTSSAAFS